MSASVGGRTTSARDLRDRGLDEQDRALIRGLRPEAAALWVATGGSALFSVLVYCGIWPLPIACGLVLGMWVHELGHRAVARRLGLQGSPIVFVPFIGAVQRIAVRPAHALDAAALALAGPACGLLFAIVCKLGYALTEHSVLRFLGSAHALLAVIDLLPFGVLDGGRVVAALKRPALLQTRKWIVTQYIALLVLGLCLL